MYYFSLSHAYHVHMIIVALLTGGWGRVGVVLPAKDRHNVYISMIQPHNCGGGSRLHTLVLQCPQTCARGETITGLNCDHGLHWWPRSGRSNNVIMIEMLTGTHFFLLATAGPPPTGQLIHAVKKPKIMPSLQVRNTFSDDDVVVLIEISQPII